jgi:hypothetical protein
MNANGLLRGFGSELVEHPIEHGLLPTFSNLLSSREAACRVLESIFQECLAAPDGYAV